MITKRIAGILTAVYMIVAASAIAYELGIRIFDRGNSEFAGILSALLTFPSSLLMIGIGKAAFGVNAGDSDLLFTVILGLSAVTNASVFWLIVRLLGRSEQRDS